jgi:hypothetical protein
MAVSNTLAYYNTATITAEKSFMVLARGYNVKKLYAALNHECS